MIVKSPLLAVTALVAYTMTAVVAAPHSKAGELETITGGYAHRNLGARSFQPGPNGELPVSAFYFPGGHQGTTAPPNTPLDPARTQSLAQSLQPGTSEVRPRPIPIPGAWINAYSSTSRVQAQNPPAVRTQHNGPDPNLLAAALERHVRPNTRRGLMEFFRRELELSDDLD